MRPRPLASPRVRAACAGALLAGVAFAAAPAAAAPDCSGIPKHNGMPVVDVANVIDVEPEVQLAADLLLHHVTGHEAIVAVTVPDLGGDDVSSYAVRLFDCWGIGDAKSDNGVLILVAMRERRVRIELGAGLDGRLTDGQLEAAIDTMVGPLRSGDVAGALRSAAETVARDLGGQLSDTKGVGSGNLPPVGLPGDDVTDAPAGFPFVDGQVPDGIGPFDPPGTPGAGVAAFVPIAIAGVAVVMIIRAVTRAASSFAGSSWRGGFPGYVGAWGPPSMLRGGSWHDVSSGSSFGDSSGGGSGGGFGGSGGGGHSGGHSGGSSGGGSSGSSGNVGGGSSGGGGASGSW